MLNGGVIMAIYHFSAQIISRGKGQSSVASAAYRSGEKIKDERLDITNDYTRKQGVVHTEILTPSNAPEWAKDRSRLWNEVEKVEKSSNSQLAREINVALPKELSREKQIKLINDFVKKNFVDKGMVADISIHDKLDGNPHAHIMLTVRPFNEDKTWGAKSKKEYILNEKGEKIKLKSGEYKSRKVEVMDWNKKETLENWREDWSKTVNKTMEREGLNERIDHRSYKEQGIDKLPTIHLGKTSNEMQKKGKENPRVELNEQIKKLNNERVIALKEYKDLKAEIEHYRFLNVEEMQSVQSAEKIIGKKLNFNDIPEIKKFMDKNKLSKEDLSSLNKAIEGLKNKEVREFRQQYRSIYPEVKTFNYDKVKAAKAANKLIEKSVPPKEIESNPENLKEVRKALEKVDKTFNKEIEIKPKTDIEHYKNLSIEEEQSVKYCEILMDKKLSYDNMHEIYGFRKSIENSVNETYDKISKLTDRAHEIKSEINYTSENLKRRDEALNELKSLPKNFFGMYKDKRRVEELKNNVKTYEENISKYGGKEGMEKLKTELEQVNKEIEGSKLKFENAKEDIKCVDKGIKALKNKEVREFKEQYKECPGIKYIGYDDVKNIERANKLIGKAVTPAEMKELSHKSNEKLNSIVNEINSIKANGERLNTAREALETIDKTKDIAEKYDNKLIGRKKYQKEHYYDKLHFDEATNKLSKCNVKDKSDLTKQEKQHSENKKKLPELEKDREVLQNDTNVLSKGDMSFNRAKSHELNHEKSMSHSYNKDLELER